MKPPSDHSRLARAFGISKTRTTATIVTTSGLALLGFATPVFWVAGAGVIAGLGGLAFGDRRTIAERLREVDAWGFPVEGYRAWLLADEPTCDLELAREVDADVIASSLRAIDPAIETQRMSRRQVRIVTRRIALPGESATEPPMLVGDRRLLLEVHDRILAPLHADVGVTRLRMGDRASLPARVPELANEPAAPSIEGAGAFRDAALVAPPALQALMGTSRELPHEARRLDRRVQRVVFATGASPHGVGTVLGLSAAGAFTGLGWFHVYGMAVGALGGLVAGITTTIEANRRNANRVAAVYRQPFPIEGYDDWLLSGRPLLDLELRRPCDRAWLSQQLAVLTAFSVGDRATIPWVEDVLWLDEQVVRIETRPTLIEPQGKIPSFYGGSHAMFGELVVKVLVPLHERVGIEAVRMGGYIDRRV